MIQKKILNLLVIDDSQIYAEHLVDLLEMYYDKVNLGFLDDKAEFSKKIVRGQWDVAIYKEAYDMKLSEVTEIIAESKVDLPVISLLSDETRADGINEEGFTRVINQKLINTIDAKDEQKLLLAIVLQQQAVADRRQMAKLRNIISEAEQRANVLIKNSKSAVAYIDEGVHIFSNKPYLEMFGYQEMDDILGVPVIDLISGGEDVKIFKEFLKGFIKGNRDEVEFKFESKRTDGSTFDAKLQLASATYDGEPVVQVIIQPDEAEGVNAEEIAKKLAEARRIDPLSGLENRIGFMEKLAETSDNVKANKQTAGLIYARMDNLGKISSSLGLQGLDATIKQVTEHLTTMFEGSYVSRFSDNVFTIIMPTADNEKLQEVAEKLRQSVENLKIIVDKRTTNTTMTIGVLLLELTCPDAETLLSRVILAHDRAVENTKNQGNAYYIYDPSEYINEDNEALAEYLKTSLINNKNFVLSYQPIYDIETDSSDMFEVYVSLNLNDGSTKPASQFMPVARDNNLASKIDRWVMMNACKALKSFKQTNANASIIVRLGGESLIDEQLPKIVAQLIKAVGGDSNALILQFHEQDLHDYLTIAKKQFARLAELKCRVSIYSFGASTKALEMIEFAKPDMVRLDRSHVGNLDRKDELDNVKRFTASINAQGVQVLMPYIEEASTMSVAWSVGARYLQGDYLQPASLEMKIEESEEE